jgi:hypothetical protein
VNDIFATIVSAGASALYRALTSVVVFCVLAPHLAIKGRTDELAERFGAMSGFDSFFGPADWSKHEAVKRAYFDAFSAGTSFAMVHSDA